MFDFFENAELQMRIAVYQYAVTGDINNNFKKICQAIEKSRSEKVDLLVFPECALTGYPPRDVRMCLL